jgi:cell filamentation protein
MSASRQPRYSTSPGIEGEFEPGSRRRVLKNKLGIRRKSEMDLAELKAFIFAQHRYIDTIEDNTVFTADLICRMHHDWLGGIYEWAGQYRTVDMSKGGFTWPPAYLVADNMIRFEKEVLAKLTPLRPCDIDEAAHALAVVHAELLLVHPFREGNGRLARWLADLMALQAGFPLPDYRLTGRGSETTERRYIDAVTKGYERDYADLEAFFRETLERVTA